MLEVQNIIYMYIALCLSMMIFNIVYMYYNSSRNKKIEKRNKKFVIEIEKQMNLIDNKQKIPKKQLKALKNKLKRPRNLNEFEDVLDEYDERQIYKYIDTIKIIFSDLCQIYIKKDAISKSYLAYIIGKYKIGKNETFDPTINYLFKLLQYDELYCIDNSMNALYKLGDIKDIIKALEIINNKKTYLNVNILLNGFLIYKGDSNLFIKELWKKFQKLNKKIKLAIIKYTSMKTNGEYNDYMYNLLNSTKNLEIKKEALNYFEYHRDDRIIENIYEILENHKKYDSDYIIEAINIIINYNLNETLNLLKNLLNEEKWEVKVKIAKALNALGISYWQLQDIYNGENEEARRILKYIENKKNNKENIIYGNS